VYGTNVVLLANRKSGYTLGMYCNCDSDLRMFLQCLYCMMITYILQNVTAMGTSNVIYFCASKQGIIAEHSEATNLDDGSPILS